MDVTLLLCDHAEAINGKLYIHGGGWNIVLSGGEPFSLGLAILIAVPWDRTNERLNVQADLLTPDGIPVTIEGHQVGVAAEFEVGRPDDLAPGSPINTPLAFNIGGIPLPIGRYEWKLSINDEPLAHRTFAVQAA
jgi:hypothetical protein